MPTKILMICLGNICRSPLAEGILKSKVDPARILVDSAGTAAYNIGEKPDPRSVAIGRKFGIEIGGQRCRKFTIRDFREFDVIYTMDKQNYRDIVALADSPEGIRKVKLLLEGTEAGILEVPDPYFGGPGGFEEVYRLIELACDHIAATMDPGS